MSRIQKFTEFGRKILAVGRNYSDHAKELGNTVPDTPLLFLKPMSACILEGEAIEIPKGCIDFQHEIELAVIIGKKCRQVPASEAMSYVGGYALALDMTARDFQREASKKGQPWALAKCIDTSCPVSQFIDPSVISDPHNLELVCKVNGEIKQKGNTKDMVFRIPELLSYISEYFTLEEGDMVLTGTPAGVGPVVAGDVIECSLSDIITCKFNVKAR
ncbi:hypothetical protein QYM36_010874 [Artemia franciscana]|uniref:Oxaloacetate tautomerase FAHD1, mitochondrial n=2 Tax=Artemia franciscana TaxID=6661 RepID=A0AA88HN70_ARTSF|nr:hypothetical protein QYM36_010874 [Artemia franciscana]